MKRLFLPLFIFLVCRAPLAAHGIFSPTSTEREHSLDYSLFSLTVSPLDSVNSARFRNCQRLSWQASKGIGKSDFGSVVSSEVGFDLLVFNRTGRLYEPRAGSNTDTSSSLRPEDAGLFRFPMTIYTGIRFSLINHRYFNAGVTGGIGFGIAPFPLFYTYLKPELTAAILPRHLAARLALTFIPESATDIIDVRNRYQEWRVTVHYSPFGERFSVMAGYYAGWWESEMENTTLTDSYRMQSVIFGCSFRLSK